LLLKRSEWEFHPSEFALNGALKTGVASSGLRSINFVATTKAVIIA
jgi:hypothetical protein